MTANVKCLQFHVLTVSTIDLCPMNNVHWRTDDRYEGQQDGLSMFVNYGVFVWRCLIMHCLSKHAVLEIVLWTSCFLNSKSDKEHFSKIRCSDLWSPFAILFLGQSVNITNKLMLDCFCWLLVLSRYQGLMRENLTIHVMALYWECSCFFMPIEGWTV